MYFKRILLVKTGLHTLAAGDIGPTPTMTDVGALNPMADNVPGHC